MTNKDDITDRALAGSKQTLHTSKQKYKTHLKSLYVIVGTKQKYTTLYLKYFDPIPHGNSIAPSDKSKPILQLAKFIP